MVALGLGALKSGLDIFGGFQRADRMRRETDEMIRRFTLQGNRAVGKAQAAGAASGVEYDSGSLTAYLTNMTSEFRKQVDWMRQAGEAGASASELSGVFGGLGDLGGSIFNFGAANKWFRSPEPVA